MAEQNRQAHTLGTDYARQLKQAKEDLAQARKFLDPQSPNYLPTYIANLLSLKQSANPPAGIEQKIATMQANLVLYQQRQAKAEQVLAEYPSKLKALAASNDLFLAPTEKQHEYLYMLDEESCQASCINWEEFDATSHDNLLVNDAPLVFKGKDNIQLTQAEQTDAVRVWANNVVVANLIISDQRTYTDAHRDAIQLIPPALGRREGAQYIRLADQMAGTIMEKVSIQNCQINAPNGPLQGIFASDGMQRQLSICDNRITTKAAHSISLAGVLDQCEISGNTLQQIAGGEVPRINLYPARIGGNIADEGVVCILGFAAEPEQLTLDYAPVSVQRMNQLIRADGTQAEAVINDMRRVIPENFMRLGIGLTEFRYHAYLAKYSSLTLAQYREFDPFGAQQLELWLSTRIQDFTQGQTEQQTLATAGTEQQSIAEKFLKPALAILKQRSAEQTRLVELDSSAIRSFTMKRLAIMHAEVQALWYLSLANARRELTLKFLLEPKHLSNLVKAAYFEARALLVGIGQVAANVSFKLFFDAEHYYSVTTDAQGLLALSQLPLGACVLIPTEPRFSLTVVTLKKPLLAPNLIQVASGLAQGLLNDLRRKIPVLEAYLLSFPAQESVFVHNLAAYLQTLAITNNQQISEAVRRDCRSLLGIFASQDEANRRVQSIALVMN